MHGAGIEEDDGQIASINIIPLVDVVLVLLIIFMVTSVFVRDSALKVDLPKGSRADQMKQPPVEITITVDKSGAIDLNGQRVKLGEIGPKINSLRNTSRKTVTVVRGDKQVYYGTIVPVMDEVSRTGVDFTLALQPGTGK